MFITGTKMQDGSNDSRLGRRLKRWHWRQEEGEEGGYGGHGDVDGAAGLRNDREEGKKRKKIRGVGPMR